MLGFTAVRGTIQQLGGLLGGGISQMAPTLAKSAKCAKSSKKCTKCAKVAKWAGGKKVCMRSG